MKKITKKKFIENYCRNSNVSWNKLKSLGMKAVECDSDCDYENCKGWKMDSHPSELLEMLKD